ncbi:MAG: ATP-binding protein [Alphaproteobacteria bacterium]
MDGIIIGARILDVLTTGMYPDALDALREYVQNSYDAIRRAERAEILKPNFGEVTVSIDTEKRQVSIWDNGIGIPAAEARSALLSIGASKKKIGDDAGFRGIGRLAGLAYCDRLVFSTAYKDEPHYTDLAFDAAGIRKSIAATSRSAENETAAELLTRLTTHRVVDRKPGLPFFEVKLIGIDQKACPFLDTDKVRTYLRQVAPVEFNLQAFVYGHSKINPFLEQHDARRTVNVTLNINGSRETIGKPYKTYHEAGNKSGNRVEIVDIETAVDPSDPPRWIAWLSTARDLRAVIVSDDVRGIRLRSNNIMVGDHRTFSRIFEKVQKSYFRMNGYYSGEVHILDTDIIPNSRRDFFEDNEAWRKAETTLIEWARPLVRRVYRNSDERNRDVDLVELDAELVFEAVDKEATQGFATEAHRAKAIDKVKTAEERIEKAMTSERTPEELESLQRKKEEAEVRRKKLSEKPRSLIDESSLSREERKILRMVMDIVQKVGGDDVATRTAHEVNKKLRQKKNRTS